MNHRDWIKGLEPHRVYELFDEICQIPHGSGNEKAISDYIYTFSQNLGLDAYQDNVGNLIIRKPATAGYENLPIVVLQAHLDMVCQKTPESTHNFDKDPIDVIVDGENIHAKDTTLGADDGTGVAFAMCVLESRMLKHPALEIVLTVNEEAGMTGIKNLDFSLLKGRVILNLDCSDEGIVVGCAGTNTHTLRLPFTNDHIEGSAYLISASGFLGGHSGLMATSGRKNANTALAFILAEIYEKIPFELVSMDGGAVDNAITRESNAIVIVSKEDKNVFMSALSKANIEIRKQYMADPDAKIICTETTVRMGAGIAATEKLLALLTLVPNGLIEMSTDVPGLAQLSANIGVVKTETNGFLVRVMTRARFGCGKMKYSISIRNLAKLLGASYELASDAPEWEYKPESRLSSLIQKIFREEYGRDIVVEISHGGNECGSFFQHYPDSDIVCSGTKIDGAHTTEETVKTSTIIKEWNMLCKTLERMTEY